MSIRTSRSPSRAVLQRAAGIVLAALCTAAAGVQEPGAQTAGRILELAGIKGGLIVHLGCGDGRLTAALRVSDSFRVQGLDADPRNVEAARAHVRGLGLGEGVGIRRWRGRRLPYVDNFVNLIVSESPPNVPQPEVMRVLCPNGVFVFRQAGAWRKVVKPRPATIGDWPHYLCDAGNNAVANDSVVGPPYHLQWTGGPKWSRHHQVLGSTHALISCGGRVFYVVDEAPRAQVFCPPEWFLTAKDAFNGTLLWKRPIQDWWTSLWLLKSGPFLLHRRIAAEGGRLYITLGTDAPVSVLDAATGKTLRTCEETRGAREVLVSDGILFVAAFRGTPPERHPFRLDWIASSRKKSSRWRKGKQHLMALDAGTGRLLWQVEQDYAPGTLAVDAGRVCFCDGTGVVCLDRRTGQQLWASEPVPGKVRGGSNFMPSLVLHDNLVFFVGAGRKAPMVGLDAKTGKQLWKVDHPPCEYASPKHIFVARGLVWHGVMPNMKDSIFWGRDPRTGEVKKKVTSDIETCWYHPRCYPPKATLNYVLTSHTGLEFVDLRKGEITPHHWSRGGCSYGIMPANGLVYTPSHPCVCYVLGMLKGFCALAPRSEQRAALRPAPESGRLERGPAYTGRVPDPRTDRQDAAAWPTYRHDAARSGRTAVPVRAAGLAAKWTTRLGGKLSSVTVADGKVFVAAMDVPAVHALDAETGQRAWSYALGAAVDSPPTVYEGRVLFGGRDGWVHCLRGTDGALIWRFRVAPDELQTSAYDRLESVWPLHGSVLVQDGAVYCVAGRSMFLDGGLRVVRLDPATGRKLSETVLDERDPATSSNVHGMTGTGYFDLNMPTMLPDILSCDGEYVYMRTQRFDRQGKRLKVVVPRWPIPEWRGGFGTKKRSLLNGKPLEPWFEKDGEKAHLFSPAGFLDDSYFHRNLWTYSAGFLGGIAGYRFSGRAYPAGKILVFDDDGVYGYGNRDRYFTEYIHTAFRLFASDKRPKAEVYQTEEKVFSHGPKQKILTRWTDENVPLMPRGLVLAGNTLFAAGAAKDPDKKLDIEQLAAQAAAWRGKKGGLLLAVEAATGRRLSETRLAHPPVWDGMAAAYGRLYIATMGGDLVCIGN